MIVRTAGAKGKGRVRRLPEGVVAGFTLVADPHNRRKSLGSRSRSPWLSELLHRFRRKRKQQGKDRNYKKDFPEQPWRCRISCLESRNLFPPCRINFRVNRC